VKKQRNKLNKRTLIFDQEGIELLAIELKKARISKDYTIRQLAFESGVSRSQIDRIEAARINPTVSTVFAIARALEIPLSELFQFKLLSK
jgi:transcriptional regulator with XRE-family HTH domain